MLKLHQQSNHWASANRRHAPRISLAQVMDNDRMVSAESVKWEKLGFSTNSSMSENKQEAGQTFVELPQSIPNTSADSAKDEEITVPPWRTVSRK